MKLKCQTLCFSTLSVRSRKILAFSVPMAGPSISCPWVFYGVKNANTVSSKNKLFCMPKELTIQALYISILDNVIDERV